MPAQHVLTVKDGSTGEPLRGVTVGNGEFQLVTDSSGTCRVPEQHYGSTVVVRHIGYRSREFVLRRTLETIRLLPDYLLLETVTVNAYQSVRPIKEVAGSFVQVPLDEVSRLGANGIVNEVNSIPGIRMERRSPGSYRINVRGSTLRSPFGVRNVKIYYNQIPVTEPSGNTPLNMLDIEHLSAVTLIRAPASSLYGAGSGGVLFLGRTAGEREGIHGTAEGSVGSYGYGMWHAGVQKRDGDEYLRVSVSGVQTDGYRDHTEMRRKNLGIQGEFRVSDVQKLSYLVLYNDLFYELPGGLTREQRDNDPTQAREIAIARNSSLNQKYLITGLSHDWQWSPGSGNQTSVFYTQSDKENPFITNYEFEDLNGAGMRTSFFHTLGLGGGQLKITAGGEWQWGRFRANNFGNDNGHPDTLRYVDDTRMFSGFEFAQLEFDQGEWHLTAGLSINHLTYRFNRLKDVALDSSYKVNRRFETRLLPRIGLSREWGNSSVFVNASWGFSPPTQDEVRTSDGAINTSLEADEALSFEAGVRSDLIPGRLSSDLTLYYIRQKNTIVSQVDASGNSVFLNSGETRHRGMEVMLNGMILKREAGMVRQIDARVSLSWNKLIFEDYVRSAGNENVDYSGNQLTGGVPLSYYLETGITFSHRIKWQVSHQFTDRIPLNDANSVYSRPYHLVRMKLEKSFMAGDTEISIFTGIDNLANEQYSLGNDLNAFGNRYFNPSPDRNYYGGVRVVF